MKNGWNANGFFGVSWVTRTSDVSSACAQDELLRQRVGVDACAEVHAEVLDFGLYGRVYYGVVESFFSDLEVGFHEQRRELQGAGVV
jgi:hypothetical protein